MLSRDRSDDPRSKSKATWASNALFRQLFDMNQPTSSQRVRIPRRGLLRARVVGAQLADSMKIPTYVTAYN